MQHETYEITYKFNPVVATLAKIALWPFCRKTESYIFVATTGRSGTGSLKHIFSKMNNCISFHEDYPIMNGYVMQELNRNNPTPAKNSYRHVRAITMRRSSIGYRYYAETNHMFIKSYSDYAIHDLGKKVKVIHLVRNPVKVAESITALNHYPGTDMGNKWYLDYMAPGNLIQISRTLEENPLFSAPFFKSLWYWYEIELRIEMMRKKYPNIPVYGFTTENLNDAEAIYQLFSDMQLDFDKEKIMSLANTHDNKKLALKPKHPLQMGDTQQMHKDFQELLIAKGYTLPASLQYFE